MTSSGPSAEFNPLVIKNAHRFSKPGDFQHLGSHDALLYHADDVEVEPQSDDVDDSFFELTANDVKKLYSELQAKRCELEDAPLLTKSARDLEKDTNTLRMLHDYPNTFVRIRFLNRFVLQGTFRTAENVQSIYNWLRELMQNPKLNFYLFTAPPKKILIEENPLVEENVVGMTVLYFGSDDPSAPSDQRILKPEFYNKISAPDAVFDFVHNKLNKLPSLISTNAVDSNSSNSEPSSCSNPSSSSGNSNNRRPILNEQPKTSKGGVVPKWFKTK